MTGRGRESRNLLRRVVSGSRRTAHATARRESHLWGGPSPHSPATLAVLSRLMSDFNAAHFRGWLQAEMRHRAISQRMLARRSGLDHSSISRLLSEGRTPSMETMARLAAALGARLPAYIAPTVVGDSIDANIRAALSELGVGSGDIEEMLSLYRRRRLQERHASYGLIGGCPHTMRPVSRPP